MSHLQMLKRSHPHHLRIWQSGCKHVMWIWCDRCCRNANMVYNLWDTDISVVCRNLTAHILSWLTGLQHNLQGRFVQVHPAGELYITDKACSEVCHEEVELFLIVDCDTECPWPLTVGFESWYNQSWKMTICINGEYFPQDYRISSH